MTRIRDPLAYWRAAALRRGGGAPPAGAAPPTAPFAAVPGTGPLGATCGGCRRSRPSGVSRGRRECAEARERNGGRWAGDVADAAPACLHYGRKGR